jgi:methyl-accepting chemotaxis protein
MNYYNIFLLDTEGNLVYSVFKENDFATNLLTGPWRISGLTEVYRRASEIEANDPSVFVDSAPNKPGNFAPAAFIARPIFDQQGKRLGVLAYLMPIAQLNAAAGDLDGPGATATGFLVGSDRLMRTDSDATEAKDILSTIVDTDAVTRGLSGAGGIFGGLGKGGQSVMGYYVPIKFLGTA